MVEIQLIGEEMVGVCFIFPLCVVCASISSFETAFKVDGTDVSASQGFLNVGLKQPPIRL